MNKKITLRETILTSIGMLIGSGIFFRADNILSATEGNLSIAILAWIVLGVAIAIAGIAMSILALHLNVEGGMAGYIEATFGKTAGFVVGWFSTLAYIPPLTGILGIVASGFIFQLIGVDANVIMVQSLAAFLIIITYFWNYLSTKFAALFSSVATVIKLLPIVIIGLVGMSQLKTDLVFGGFSTFQLGLFTAPLLSIAFAFDGWTNICTISKDMVNPQRDTAKALVMTSFIVTVAYVVYFTGISMMLPINEIISLGDDHVGVIAGKIFGDFGGKLLLFCVIVSVLGTLNGNIMAGQRYAHALAVQKDLPYSDYFVKESKYKTTGRAALIPFAAVTVWMILYTLQGLSKEARANELLAQPGFTSLPEAEQIKQQSQFLFTGISFDDIPIMAVSVVIIIALIAAIIVGNKHNVGIFKGIVAPIIGIISQIYIIVSFVQTNNAWLLYTVIVIIVMFAGYVMRKQLLSYRKKKIA